MELIENFNCDRICNEAYCDQEHTHFCNFEFAGMKIHLAFCKKHGEEFENKVIEHLQMKHARAGLLKPRENFEIKPPIADLVRNKK